ncbi:NAD(P)/FAD-dependent oxidoreductase [Phenylobacterium sp.]|jgi:glycine/D-amino acid oxidase-like deaminating enzyme|uniref:NAD(P)/FAD-dependent oxidoreductase n=1 Tax=Phenylobacterium sp. TaxID=1871053 RepID=UPI003783941A
MDQGNNTAGVDGASRESGLLNGGVSYWYSDIGLPARRAALAADDTADVCIVGGGLTGLWTAYYLKTLNPKLAVTVLEKNFAGFGASGRNGGNLTGGFPWARRHYLKHGTADRLGAFERALAATVDEVVGVLAKEGIDADILRAGNLAVATNAAQQARMERRFEAWKARPEGVRLLSRTELAERVQIANGSGAIFDPTSVRVQPAKLVRGLAAVVEAKGVRIYEDTTVTEILPGRVSTFGGPKVRAPIVIRATEGFTPTFPSLRDKIIPLNSAIIVTEPLSEDVLATWPGGETVSELSHAYAYCQRTRGGRITVGGRGVPYRFNSGIDDNGRTQEATIATLVSDLRRLFPHVAHAKIEQAWCGVLGMPRDWCARVSFDKATGLASGGGYVGGGLAASNLAGRTLADLVLGRDTELATLPWVNMPERRWEGEPLRWLGISALYGCYHIADSRERSGKVSDTSRFATFASAISGRDY